MSRLQEVFQQMQQQPSEHKDSRVLIVDGLNMYIRIWAAVPALNEDGEHVGGVVGFLKSLGALIRQFDPTRCIVVFDGKGGSQRRRKVYNDYKSNRKTKIQLNRFEDFADLEDEQQSMKAQLSRLVQYLHLLPVTVFSIDNIEADDSIAYIAQQYYETQDNSVVIASTDKDFLQLVNDKITVWNPVKKKLYNREQVVNEFQLTPHNYVTYRAVTGDKSDNIIGVKGVGLKTLLKSFPNITSEDVTVQQLIEEAKDKDDRIAQKIYDNREVILRNHKIMQLKDSDISASSALNIAGFVKASIKKLDSYNFKKLYMEDKLYANIHNLDQWLVSTFNRLNLYGDIK